MKFVKSTIHQPTPATAGAPAPAPVAAEPEERVLTFGDVFGRDAGGLIVLLVLFGGMTLASTEFLTADNMANLARQVAVFGIIAVGQLLVILTAGIDLSVGSVLGLTGAITAELLVHGVGILPAILVGMAAGAAIGVFNGSLVAYGKLPPFIVTLGMLGIARGVVLVLTDASTVQPLPDSFTNIANGAPAPGTSCPADHPARVGVSGTILATEPGTKQYDGSPVAATICANATDFFLAQGSLFTIFKK